MCPVDEQLSALLNKLLCHSLIPPLVEMILDYNGHCHGPWWQPTVHEDHDWELDSECGCADNDNRRRMYTKRRAFNNGTEILVDLQDPTTRKQQFAFGKTTGQWVANAFGLVFRPPTGEAVRQLVMEDFESLGVRFLYSFEDRITKSY